MGRRSRRKTVAGYHVLMRGYWIDNIYYYYSSGEKWETRKERV